MNLSVVSMCVRTAFIRLVNYFRMNFNLKPDFTVHHVVAVWLGCTAFINCYFQSQTNMSCPHGLITSGSLSDFQVQGCCKYLLCSVNCYYEKQLCSLQRYSPDNCSRSSIIDSQTVFSGRDKRIPGRPPLSPRMERPRGQGPRPMPPQGDRLVQPSACCCCRTGMFLTRSYHNRSHKQFKKKKGYSSGSVEILRSTFFSDTSFLSPVFIMLIQAGFSEHEVCLTTRHTHF